MSTSRPVTTASHLDESSNHLFAPKYFPNSHFSATPQASFILEGLFQAMQLWEQGAYHEALSISIMLSPNADRIPTLNEFYQRCAVDFFNQCTAHIQGSRFNEALELLDRAQALRLQLNGLPHLRAFTLAALNRWSEALTAIDAELVANPSNAQAQDLRNSIRAKLSQQSRAS